MGYRRASLCSYCRNYGHNKRGCPTMKERAQQAASKPTEERSWTEQRAIMHVEEYKSAAVSRSCSYCSGTGHNTKGCSIRKIDISAAIDNLISYRKKMLASFKKHGIGIGAILSCDGYLTGFGYASETKPHYVLVRGFELAYMTPWNYNIHNRSTSLINCKHLSDLDNKTNAHYNTGIVPPISVLNDIIDQDVINYNTKTLVESPTSYVGIDEAQFISYTVCSELVTERFQQKHSRNKPSTRGDLVYDRVIPDRG